MLYICITFKNKGIFINNEHNAHKQKNKMRTINIHMISISNWRRNSHHMSGMSNCEGGTEV
jgi:hypothetical protein